jgi:uncharacterized protein
MEVGIFPLPGVIVLPRGVVPLHIFEPRYRAMTRHALENTKHIAMAVPHIQAGGGKDPGQAPIQPVVCVCRIEQHELLEDGRFHLVLQGVGRATIGEERMDPEGFRIARMMPLPESLVLEIDLTTDRQRLLNLFGTEPLARYPGLHKVRQLLAGADSTSDIADLLGYWFLPNGAMKLQLLNDTDIARRVRRVVTQLEDCRVQLANTLEQQRLAKEKADSGTE